MKEMVITRIDLAKNVSQPHGTSADGSVVFRKKLTRVQYHKLMLGHPGRYCLTLSAGDSHRECMRLDGA